MRVDPKTLVRRLNPATTRMLEGAVGHAASGQYYEITCEHLLLKVLESADGDAELLLTHFGQRRLAVAQRVQRALERMKTGNAGRPVFSESLFQWMEDAWVVASLNYGATQLRSGHLLLQFIDRPSRYTGEAFAELETISPPELRKQFEDILAGSPETPPAPAAGQAGGAPAGGGGGDAPTGEEALKRFTTSFTASAKARPDLRASRGDPPAHRHPGAPPQEQPDHRRRAGRRQERARRGPRLAIVNGDVPDAAQGRRPPRPRPRRAPGRREREGRVREPPEGRHQRGEGLAEADRPVHRRGAHASSAPAAGRAAATRPTCSSRRSRAASCARSRPPRGRSTRSTSRRTRRSSGASSRSRSTSRAEERAIVMLRGLRAKFEEAHGVIDPRRGRHRRGALSAPLHLRPPAARQGVDLLDTAPRPREGRAPAEARPRRRHRGPDQEHLSASSTPSSGPRTASRSTRSTSASSAPSSPRPRRTSSRDQRGVRQGDRARGRRRSSSPRARR
jgi:hypothetical protein